MAFFFRHRKFTAPLPVKTGSSSPDYQQAIHLVRPYLEFSKSQKTFGHMAQSGHHILPKSGPGDDFWQHRDYHVSDDLKNIDWRHSARSDTLYIRQHHHPAIQKLTFWVPASSAFQYTSQADLLTKKAYCQILIAALGLYYFHQGYQCRLNNLPILSGVHQFGKWVSMLEEINTDLSFKELLQVPNHKHAYFHTDSHILISDFLPLTPFITTLQSSALSAKLGHKVTVCRLHDPTEATFPYNGNLSFSSLSVPSNAPISLQATSGCRSAYQQLWHQEQHLLANICHQKKWSFVTISTESPLADTLKTLLPSQRERR